VGNRTIPILLAFVVLSLPLSGCTEPITEKEQIDAEVLVQVEDPCSLPSEPITQSMTIISVNGVDRLFRLTVPSSDSGVKLALVIAFHGGGMADEDFNQQDEFDQLAEQEKFIMAYAIAEDGRTESEGEWYLNTAATSRDDNDFALTIVNELSKSYCVDQDRLYAIGYSLGSMFTYEVACQLNYKFAAVASFAGTMPVEPETCDLIGSMSVMHIHGKLDLIIDYDDDWDWKDGEHEGVGTMSNIPGMIDYWAEKSNCQNVDSHYHQAVEHIVHSDCVGGVIVEHHGLEFGGHTWPDDVAGTETYILIWDFLSRFTN
jgi:polyhydroxybutyrate depolymerase